MRRFAAWSAPPPAKSSNAVSATRMMWSAMNSAPSRAPSSGCLRQHSHSSTAQPGKSYGRHLREDRREVDLPVAERAEAAGAVDPGLEAAVDALPAGRVELGILDVEDLDALVVDVDVVEVVELLQHEVARVVEHGSARVAADALEEHLEGHAVVQVLAGVDLVADVDARIVEGVEDRPPALGQLVEGGLDQPGRPLRPGIDDRARPARRRRWRAPSARGWREALAASLHLLDRPLLRACRVAAHLRRGEAVEAGVVGRMHRDELALQVGRQLGDLRGRAAPACP